MAEAKAEMAVTIKSARVDDLLDQLRALTGQGPTEIMRQVLLQGLPFDPESLYDVDGLPA